MFYDTIEFREPYKDLNTVLYWLVQQATEGVPYCVESFPEFKDPAEMFYYLKGRVSYHNDPKGVELIQSPGTLMENNYFGIPGAGDCDCFTTLLLAACWAQGWNECFILLYGRTKKNASHISMCVIFDGTPYIMDLTQKGFDSERQYPFYQELPVFN